VTSRKNAFWLAQACFHTRQLQCAGVLVRADVAAKLTGMPKIGVIFVFFDLF
jgi:hypothetical protein